MLTRRNLFAAAGGLAAGGMLGREPRAATVAPRPETLLGTVKIRDVKTASIKMTYYSAHLVKIETDDPTLYGLGEAYIGSGVVDHIQWLKRSVIGEDPLNVEFLYQKMADAGTMYGSRSGILSGAIAGIESALWDLAGKILNVPIYTLLGGKFRDRVLVYHDTGAPNDLNPQPWVDEMQRSLALGFKALKVDLNRFRGERWNRALVLKDMGNWTRILEAIRAAIGPDVPLGVDLHWAFSARDVMRFLERVEDLNLWFLEDPIPPESAVEAFVKITQASKTPIATGENLFTRAMFRPYIEQQACDYLQPDTQKCGGLLETKRVADWGELYSMPMFCHNMCTPVGAIGSGHVCMAARSAIALESDSIELPYWADLIVHDGPIYKDGYLEFANKPGLGVELNEEVCRKHLAEGSGFFE